MCWVILWPGVLGVERVRYVHGVVVSHLGLQKSHQPQVRVFHVYILPHFRVYKRPVESVIEGWGRRETYQALVSIPLIYIHS